MAYITLLHVSVVALTRHFFVSRAQIQVPTHPTPATEPPSQGDTPAAFIHPVPTAPAASATADASSQATPPVLEDYPPSWMDPGNLDKLRQKHHWVAHVWQMMSITSNENRSSPFPAHRCGNDGSRVRTPSPGPSCNRRSSGKQLTSLAEVTSSGPRDYQAPEAGT